MTKKGGARRNVQKNTPTIAECQENRKANAADLDDGKLKWAYNITGSI